ncbi:MULTISPECIES: DMT family transporter [Actinosynnema]|uniref:EamA family transporter n=1 Tax=Actinosynnema TaxID=40566 RepID=UPI0020A2440E|nr:EamA family transporter [Actinosynnema pretiosum]MCP2095516.1 inner membrane transporter RhtA [Actinosynnema pretiosum]
MVTAHVDSSPAPRSPLGAASAALARGAAAVPPTALLLVGVISVQVGAAVAKNLFAQVGSAGAVTLRLVLAALVLLAVWRPSVRMPARTWAVVGGFGVVLGTMNLLIYQAIERIPLGAAVTIEFLGPLAVAVLGSRRWVDGVWAVLAGGGVLMLARADGGLSFAGVAFALAAAACWAAYILLSAAVGGRTSGGSGLALAMVVGSLVALPFGIGSAGAQLVDPHVLLVGLGVALLSSVVPYSLELEALRRIPSKTFGVLMSLGPAAAALAGLVLLGERLDWAQWVAVGCVVAASVGATRSARR